MADDQAPPEGEQEEDDQPISKADLEKATADAAKRAVADFRKSQADATKKKADEDKAKEEDDYRQLYETQKLEAESLKRKVRLADAQAALQRKQARYPEVLAGMIPEDAEDLDKAAADLQKKYPEYFVVHQADGGAGSGAQTNPFEGDFNNVIRRAAGRG